MEDLLKLWMNALYGIQNKKDPNEFYKCKSQRWMETELDDIALGYWNLPNGKYILKKKL